MDESGLPVRNGYAVVGVDRVPEREGMVVFLSSSKREGRWTLPRHTRVAAVLGSAQLDLREAEIADGVSDIEILAVLGSVEVFVPVGVRVECTGHALLGSFETRMSGVPDFAPNAPTIRVKGSAYGASVEVVVRPIGRRQLRAEQRLQQGKT